MEENLHLWEATIFILGGIVGLVTLCLLVYGAHLLLSNKPGSVFISESPALEFPAAIFVIFSVCSIIAIYCGYLYLAVFNILTAEKISISISTWIVGIPILSGFLCVYLALVGRFGDVLRRKFSSDGLIVTLYAMVGMGFFTYILVFFYLAPFFFYIFPEDISSLVSKWVFYPFSDYALLSK